MTQKNSQDVTNIDQQLLASQKNYLRVKFQFISISKFMSEFVHVSIYILFWIQIKKTNTSQKILINDLKPDTKGYYIYYNGVCLIYIFILI